MANTFPRTTAKNMFADSISHQSMTDNIEKTKMKPIARVRLSDDEERTGKKAGRKEGGEGGTTLSAALSVGLEGCICDQVIAPYVLPWIWPSQEEGN